MTEKMDYWSTFSESVPYLITFGLWLTYIVFSISAIQRTVSEEWAGAALIINLFIILSLVKYMPSPRIIYREVRE